MRKNHGKVRSSPERSSEGGGVSETFNPSARRSLEEVIDGQDGNPVALPAAVQAGASWTRELSRGFAVTTALDTRATRGRQAVASAGAELSSNVGAALRAGFREGDDLANFSAGVGYRRGTFSVDYAFVPARFELGDTHRFSFAAQF